MEELNKILLQAFVVVLSGLLTYLTTLISSFLKAKKDELVKNTKLEKDRFVIENTYNIIDQAVRATNENIVDGLKERSKDGKLTKEEAISVFNITKDNITNILSDDAKKVLEGLYGNVDSYIEQCIASAVTSNKTSVIRPKVETKLDLEKFHPNESNSGETVMDNPVICSNNESNDIFDVEPSNPEI